MSRERYSQVSNRAETERGIRDRPRSNIKIHQNLLTLLNSNVKEKKHFTLISSVGGKILGFVTKPPNATQTFSLCWCHN